MKAMELYGCDVQIKIKENEKGIKKAYVLVLSESPDSVNEKKVMAVAKYLWDEGFIEDEEIDVNVVYIGDGHEDEEGLNGEM